MEMEVNIGSEREMNGLGLGQVKQCGGKHCK